MALRFLCLSALIAGEFIISYGQFEPFGGIPDVGGEGRDHCILNIRPSPVMEINEGENGILYCEIMCGAVTNQTLEWRDNTGNTVPHIPRNSENTGARYWLQQRILRLDISPVRPDHEGLYVCKGYVQRKWISRSTYLRVIVRARSTKLAAPSSTAATAEVSSSLIPSNGPVSSADPTTLPVSSTNVHISSRSTSMDTRTEHPLITSEPSTYMTSSYVTSVPTTELPELSTQTGAIGTIGQSTTTTSSDSQHEHSDATVSEHISSSDAPAFTVLPTSPMTSPEPTIELSSTPQNKHAESVTTPTRHEYTGNNESAGDAQDTSLGTTSSTTAENDPISSSTVIFIPAPMVHRKKRSPDNNGKDASGKNGTMVGGAGVYLYPPNTVKYDPMANDTLAEACSGFGPTAIATIAILGAVCLILLYAFILVLCLPKFRKRNSANLEKPPKDIEEGGCEGIEMKEDKPEIGESDPNGRIMHDESGFTTIDINETESYDITPVPATEDACRSKDVEALATQERKGSQEESQIMDENVPEDKEVPEKSTVVVESPPPALPVPLFAPVEPLEIQQRVELDQCEMPPVAVESVEEAPSSETDDVESSLSEALSPEPEELPIREDLPVFDEPIEDDIEPILVSSQEPNVELRDKSVDTVELEAEDLEEPLDNTSMEMTNHVTHEDMPDRERGVPIFDTDMPERNGLQADDGMSNGLQEDDHYPVTKTISDRDEMTKSIEDLPPPPPIPVGPLPPPPLSSDPSKSGMEAPDVVSSNTTLV